MLHLNATKTTVIEKTWSKYQPEEECLVVIFTNDVETLDTKNTTIDKETFL